MRENPATPPAIIALVPPRRCMRTSAAISTIADSSGRASSASK